MPMLTMQEAAEHRAVMRATVAQWTPNLAARPMLEPLPEREMELSRLLTPAWRYKKRLLILAEVEQHDGARWLHVSFSMPRETPSHDDVFTVRRMFFRRDSLVLQLFPPMDEYVNLHHHTLHLWERLDGERLVPDVRRTETDGRVGI